MFCLPSAGSTPNAACTASAAAMRGSLALTAFAMRLEGVSVSSRATRTIRTAVCDLGVSRKPLSERRAGFLYSDTDIVYIYRQEFHTWLEHECLGEGV